LPAYLLGVASLEPHTPDELLALACERHPELLTTAEDTTLRAAITNLHKADLLARERKPYRYTITRAGEEEANRVYDERMKRGAA
jgi:hypothetical protein